MRIIGKSCYPLSYITILLSNEQNLLVPEFSMDVAMDYGFYQEAKHFAFMITIIRLIAREQTIKIIQNLITRSGGF